MTVVEIRKPDSTYQELSQSSLFNIYVDEKPPE